MDLKVPLDLVLFLRASAFLSPLLASLLAFDKNSERRFRFGQKVDPAIHTILKQTAEPNSMLVGQK